MPVSEAYHPEILHASLGPEFFDEVEAARFPKTLLRYRNQRWAERVGLGSLSDEEWTAYFARFESLPGGLAKPLALRYHGHQFRSYNPDLGDGRGFLFAQLRDADGRLLDLGTKGSGRTPWSRQGDGRLTLKGGVREVLATEMLEAVGVETSKSFSLFETGEALMRGDEPSPTRSSVLTRLSHSHVRIGTFQRLAFYEDRQGLEKLTAYVIAQYFPELSGAGRPAEALLAAVTARCARLAASYMTAGFVHGVLNSDNINITGESFDYGPWRFAPTWDAGFTAAYFDEIGLYAFGRQPGAIAWCLARLAECLLPLIGLQTAQRIAESYADLMRAAFRERLLFRLGLDSAGEEQDAALAKSFVDFMLASRAPFEQAFFDWRGGLASLARAEKSPAAALYESPFFAPVRAALAPYRASAHAHLDHPYFAGVEPCTMMIDEVERIWDSIARRDDWGPFEEKISQISVLREACSLQA